MKYTSIFALTLLAAVPALAQPFDRTWVSERSGNDANNCLFAMPCLTFQGAYAKTNSGVIILAIDAGGYGPVNVSTPSSSTATALARSSRLTPARACSCNQGAPRSYLRLCQLRGAGNFACRRLFRRRFNRG